MSSVLISPRWREWHRIDNVLPKMHISNIDAVSRPPITMDFFLLNKERPLPNREYARIDKLLPNLRKFNVDMQLPHLLRLRIDSVLPVELTFAIDISMHPPM
jgi:hypothetical protein